MKKDLRSASSAMESAKGESANQRHEQDIFRLLTSQEVHCWGDVHQGAPDKIEACRPLRLIRKHRVQQSIRSIHVI